MEKRKSNKVRNDNRFSLLSPREPPDKDANKSLSHPHASSSNSTFPNGLGSPSSKPDKTNRQLMMDLDEDDSLPTEEMASSPPGNHQVWRLKLNLLKILCWVKNEGLLKRWSFTLPENGIWRKNEGFLRLSIILAANPSLGEK
mmetsp:Transcript_38188/g.50305  ORF Transcript_38188/g.50305 Transcript_38188/m.50305 type:complete len:143 (+) Transcript_38188:120-548(+)|eukprot:CAMPEP_0117755676 /NCGR_PEP_ID=MMETSP0947-20121206/13589_1 /TAXON_ID=44440 /ORGANISM="Chattonella subsalsa, Strain CCMP2191" /LENGTH=142 /DNA_ID=CAMNT_0005575047 /DNA_START=906 /DNA_END=1334 /DNA_ORIENTATION=-